MARGFHVIPASENPPGGLAGIAMDQDDSGTVLGVQICDDCIFECNKPTELSDCGAAACPNASQPSLKPVTVTANINLGNGGCAAGCSLGSDYPNPPPCGSWITCTGSPRCDPCPCGSGSYVLDVLGQGGDPANTCSWGLILGPSEWTNCCAGGGSVHSLVIRFKLFHTGPVTATASVTVTDTSAAFFSTTATIPNCENFTLNLPWSSGDCPGSFTANG